MECDMDPTQTTDDGSGTSAVPQVVISVEGQSNILITDFKCKGMSNHKSSMRYYVGEVKTGGGFVDLPGTKATILCFEGGIAKDIHDRLIRVSHPYVLRSLGYGRGLGEYSRYEFLALPYFETTFAELVRDRERCVQMDRWTEEFIRLIGHIVKAILALHDAGFCCSKLKTQHIAIVRHHNSITAKIWNFEKCISDKDKPQDWVRLTKLLKLTGLWSKEAEDLYDNMLNGHLQGLDILQHSAMSTVTKKFDDMLKFFFYMSVNWPKGGKQTSTQASTSEIVEAPAWLDESLNWASHIPTWIFAKSLTDQSNTYRGFSSSSRNLIEHEVDFLAPELINEITPSERLDGKTEMDLESHMRKAWAEAILKVQNFVRTKKLGSKN